LFVELEKNMRLNLNMVRFKELVFDKKSGKKVLVEKNVSLGKNEAVKLLIAGSKYSVRGV